MNIALVKRHYSLQRGGSERYCVMLARGLLNLGHAVTVIGESIDEELTGEVGFIAVRVNRLTSWTNNRSFAENCRLAAQSRPFDIVYGLGRAFGLDAVRVTERLQSHWVNVRYHPAWFRRLQKWNPRHRTLIDLERTIYTQPAVRRIVTQSQLDRQLLMQYYAVPAEKIRTVYNGVDTEQFHPRVRTASADIRREWRLPRNAPLLLFASMDFAGKGLASILQALARLENRDARLLILGNGPLRRFEKMAESLGVRERVVFAGRQDGIERFYGAADLFLLPTAYEPFPNVNLEAMACGTPVLTTTTSGSADIIAPGHTGYFLSGMNAVSEIVRHIDYHLSLPGEERDYISRCCREMAETMTVERNVRETVAVFEDVLREKRRDGQLGLRNVG